MAAVPASSDEYDPTGGYSCEPVNHADPKDHLKCKICHLIIREPHVEVNCGEQFCKGCIENVQKADEPCPICKASSFQIYPQNKSRKEIQGLQVYCINKKQGCDWQGALKNLEGHLNFSGNSKENECAYQKVACSLGCGERYERRLIEQHETENCMKRSTEQQLQVMFKVCNDVKQEMSVLQGRLEQSEETVQQHTQEITALGQKINNDAKMAENLEDVRKRVTETQQLTATNKTAIDTLEKKVKKLSGDLEETNQRILEHINTQLTEKLKEMKTKAEAESKRLRSALRQEQQTSQNLQDEVTYLKKMLLPVLPVEFTMDNFSFYRNQNLEWHSPPFYLSEDRKSYKFSLYIHANGVPTANRKYMSVYALPRKVCNDQLQWPIQSLKLNVILKFSEKDYTNTITMKDCKKVLRGDRATTVSGKEGTWNFISQTELKTLMKDESELHIRVEKSN